MKAPAFDPGWPADVRALYRHDLREIWDRSIAPQVWNQYHNQLDLYLAIAGDRPLSILDVGCAQGTLALMLAERGHHVIAVDIRPQFLEYARSRHTHGKIAFLVANALEDEIPGGHDLIFANQIIEHLVYPAELLGRLMRLLKPGGRQVTTTPNGAYFKNTLPSYADLGNPCDLEHLQFTADGDGHFFAYRANELRSIFQASGYVDIHTRYFETPFISGHFRIRHLHRYTPVGLLKVCDRLALAIPGVARATAHQLLLTGVRPLK